MSFQDVKAIYDSLPEDQKRLVSPRGEFVDSPRLAIRTVTPEKDGFAEAYNMPGNKAFVTLAVSPDAQGKGKGLELLQQTIARARVDGIRKLIYRLASSNEASKALVRKFVDKPHRKGKDWEEYIIDPATAKDPYSAKLPPSVVKAVEDMKGVYKDMGYDLSDVGVKGTTRSRFESGAVAPFGIMPKEQQVGASWVKSLNSIYFNPDIKAAMKLYGLKGSQEDFVRSLAAHELAHAVDQRYADDKMRKKVLTAAGESGFTTPYLDKLPFEQNRDKEVFAEWLASKVMEKNHVTKTASANMVALEKVAELAQRRMGGGQLADRRVAPITGTIPVGPKTQVSTLLDGKKDAQPFVVPVDRFLQKRFYNGVPLSEVEKLRADRNEAKARSNLYAREPDYISGVTGAFGNGHSFYDTEKKNLTVSDTNAPDKVYEGGSPLDTYYANVENGFYPSRVSPAWAAGNLQQLEKVKNTWDAMGHAKFLVDLHKDAIGEDSKWLNDDALRREREQLNEAQQRLADATVDYRSAHEGLTNALVSSKGDNPWKAGLSYRSPLPAPAGSDRYNAAVHETEHALSDSVLKSNIKDVGAYPEGTPLVVFGKRSIAKGLPRKVFEQVAGSLPYEQGTYFGNTSDSMPVNTTGLAPSVRNATGLWEGPRANFHAMRTGEGEFYRAHGRMPDHRNAADVSETSRLAYNKMRPFMPEWLAEEAEGEDARVYNSTRGDTASEKANEFANRMNSYVDADAGRAFEARRAGDPRKWPDVNIKMPVGPSVTIPGSVQRQHYWDHHPERPLLNSQITRNGNSGELGTAKYASANMTALEKVAGLAGLLGSGIGVLAGSAHRSGELGDAAFGGLLGGASGLVGGSFLAGGKRDGESDDEYRRRRNTDALIWAGILGALGAGAGHALGGSSQNGQR